MGRFISEDEIGDRQGANLYSYAGDGPIQFRDPTGLDYSLAGFSAAQESLMDQAIVYAVRKIGKTCCAGANGPNIQKALLNADYVFAPASLGSSGYGYCGYRDPRKPNTIIVSEAAFQKGHCCSLAAVLAHEADHVAGATDQDKPGGTYDMEKKCFNCGSGHPPPNPY